MKNVNTQESLLVSERQIFEKRKRKNRLVLLLLGVLLLLAVLYSITVGAGNIDGSVVLRVLFEEWFPSDEITKVQRIIIWDIRLPRVMGALFAGMLLAGAGVLMQSVLQNPLVSPYTLGVSNGAALGATVAIVFGTVMGFSAYNTWLIPSFAFVFAIATMLLVILVSKVSRDTSRTLILAGVAVGYLVSAATSLIKYMADTVKLPELVFWSMGGIAGITWEKVNILVVTCLVAMTVLVLKAPQLQVMAAGEETALSLGVNYKHMRTLSFILSTVMTAVAVSFVGVIGFIGLVAPHLSRMMVGNDFRYRCPASILMGGLILVLSDALARTIIAPTELPVGIITSVLGVPFYLFLIIRRGRKY